MSEINLHFLDFGPFRLDPLNRELTHSGSRVPLTPRALDTLLALVELNGQLVEKARLLRQVWPDTFVAEPTLTQNVYTIRKALERLDDVEEARINLVMSPPWSPDRMTDDARDQLGIF